MCGGEDFEAVDVELGQSREGREEVEQVVREEVRVPADGEGLERGGEGGEDAPQGGIGDVRVRYAETPHPLGGQAAGEGLREGGRDLDAGEGEVLERRDLLARDQSIDALGGHVEVAADANRSELLSGRLYVSQRGIGEFAAVGEVDGEEGGAGLQQAEDGLVLHREDARQVDEQQLRGEQRPQPSLAQLRVAHTQLPPRRMRNERLESGDAVAQLARVRDRRDHPVHASNVVAIDLLGALDGFLEQTRDGILRYPLETEGLQIIHNYYVTRTKQC